MEQPRPVTTEDLARLKAELLEALHEMETRLLRAFFQYQEHADIKFRNISADVSNVNAAAELRLNNLEQRVVEIEKRLMLGGAA